jgi:hypothetical protein
MRMAVAGMVMGVILAGVIAIGSSASMRMMRMSGSVTAVSLMFIVSGRMNMSARVGMSVMRATGVAVAGMIMGVILAGVIAIGSSASMRMMRMSGSVMGVSLMFFAPGWMNVGLCMWMSVMRAMGVAGGAMRMEAPALTGARFRGCGDLLVAKRPNLDLLVRERRRDWSSDGRRGKSGDDADKEGRSHAGPLDVII